MTLDNSDDYMRSWGCVQQKSPSCQSPGKTAVCQPKVCQPKVPPIRGTSTENVQTGPASFPEMIMSWLSIPFCCSADITKAPAEVPEMASAIADTRFSSLEDGEIREGIDAISEGIDPAKDRLHGNLPLAQPVTPTTAPPTGTTRRSKSSSSLGSNDCIDEELPKHQSSAAEIHAKMRKFVKEMVRGAEINVLSIDGQLKTCTCSLDRKLRFFVIEVARRVRKIPLSTIKEVQQGLEPEDIETPLDALCATLILATDECISFRFATVPERQDFALCLSVLLDGRY